MNDIKNWVEEKGLKLCDEIEPYAMSSDYHFDVTSVINDYLDSHSKVDVFSFIDKIDKRVYKDTAGQRSFHKGSWYTIEYTFTYIDNTQNTVEVRELYESEVM